MSVFAEVVKKLQLMTFTSTAPAGAIIGDSYIPAAGTTSGLPVEFTIATSSASVCTLSGGEVSFTAAGSCVINADQPGNSTWLPAPQASQKLSVSTAPATCQPFPDVSTSKPFNDVAMNSTFCKPISWMKTNKITFGVGDGSNYGTTQIVNRQSMASFLHRIYNDMH